jgi:hypothetical protein
MNVTADAASAPRRQPHPSPHRGRVGPWTTWLAILGAPSAWNLQLLINTTLVGHGCYPHDVPLATPTWNQLGFISVAVEVTALAICVAAGVAGWRNWSRTRDEKQGDLHHLVESGDGRTRFMAVVGIMTSALFLVATAFATLNLAGVPQCGG